MLNQKNSKIDIVSKLQPKKLSIAIVECAEISLIVITENTNNNVKMIHQFISIAKKIQDNVNFPRLNGIMHPQINLFHYPR